MGQRLNDVRFIEGKLIGILRDGSKVQLESATPDFISKGSWNYGYMPDWLEKKIKSLPEDYYVHVGFERHHDVASMTAENISTQHVEIVPYTVYKGRKIANSPATQIPPSSMDYDGDSTPNPRVI